MIRVTAPNPRFSGVRVGLSFRGGQATAEALTGRQRQGLARLGYAVEGDELAGMTVRELRALAAERGVDLGNATRKADIVNALS